MVLFLTVACAFLVVFSYGVSLFWRAEQFDLALITQQGDESMLYDTNNKLMCKLSGQNHRQISYQDIPQHLVHALLAREDEHFFDHGGVQYLSIIRSALRNAQSMRYAQGASTISMQLARNVFELRDKSLDRKALEIVLTYLIESKYDKETILTQYLNRIYFGENCYGLGDAAAHYFSKEVKELNLNESATLIGLVRGPSIFNPVRDMARAIQVRNETLARMVQAQLLDASLAEQVKQEEILLTISDDDDCVRSYPLVAVHARLNQLNVDLGDKTASIAVVTEINKNVQAFVEKSVETCLSFMEGDGPFDAAWLDYIDKDKVEQTRQSWAKLKRPKKMPTRGKDGIASGLQCVVIVIDSRRYNKGDVLAYMAGRDACDAKDYWQRMVKPGRALAPLIFCAAMQAEHGAIPIVASSAEVTGRKMGYKHLSEYMQNVGFFTDLPDAQHGEDLCAGHFEMRLEALARLYHCILHHGVSYEWNFLQGIYSQNRHLLYLHEPTERPEIIRRELARVVSNIAPFHSAENRASYLNEALLDGTGQWCVVSDPKLQSISVLLWVGYDSPTEALRKDDDLAAMLDQFPSLLARMIYAESRRIMVADKKQRDAEEKARKEAEQGDK